MVYLGLMMGAKGLIYYPWDDGPCGLIHDRSLMEEVARLNREVQQLAPWLAGERMVMSRGRDGFLTIFRGCENATKGGEDLLLLAANAGTEPLVLQAGDVYLRETVAGNGHWGDKGIELPPLGTLAAKVRRKGVRRGEQQGVGLREGR